MRRREEVDPVYLDAPYYVYPDGALAIEAFRVIGEALAAKGLCGLGQITLNETNSARGILTHQVRCLRPMVHQQNVVPALSKAAHGCASDTRSASSNDHITHTSPLSAICGSAAPADCSSHVIPAAA